MVIDLSYKWDKNDMGCSRITLDSNYMCVKSDQRAYQFIYDDYIRFDRLIVAEDVERFYDFMCDNEAPAEKFVLVRLKRSDGVYRLCLIFALQRRIPVNNTFYTEIELRDLVTLSNRYKKLDLDVKKYRSYLGMIPEYFFEYNPETEEFSLFVYNGFRSDTIVKGQIKEVFDDAVAKEYVAGENVDRFMALLEKIRCCEESFTVELETSIFSKGEMSETFSFHGQAMSHDNKLVRIVGIVSHVARLGKATSVIENGSDASDKDPATGILNKKAMAEFVINKIRYYKNSDDDQNFWLVICDIDNFKSVNDTYGHLFGDEVIYRFAQTIRVWAGDRGAVGRIGGDEFMILIENADVTELRAILKGIRAELEWAFRKKARDYRFTTSMGIAKYPDDAVDYERLFKTADKALYIAKEKGRDRFIIYTKELHGELEEDQDGEFKAHVPVQMKPIDKMELAADLIESLMKKGRSAIPAVFQELIERLNIHGISVFERNADSRFILGISEGKYNIPIEDISDRMDDKYFALFDENGINVVNNVKGIEIKCPMMYDYWTEHDICSTMQFITGSREHAKAVISFDIFGGHKRKWNSNDVDVLYLIMKFVGNALES